MLSIGIIKGFNGGKCFISFPLLDHKLNLSLIDLNGKLGDRLLCNINNNNVTVIKNYGSINIRSNDVESILDVYNSIPDVSLNWTISDSYYTKPFQNLNHLNTFTIDPTTSKDFDDAISIDISNNIFYIHIVDIHNQLPINSDIDIIALCRASTIYLPEIVSNMLPSELADNAYSLIENQERKVITIQISNDSYDLNSYDIYPSSIIVKKRYDYIEANNSLNTPDLNYIRNYALQWHKNKLVIPVVKIINNNITLERYDDDAHKMIEYLMFLANITISKHLQGKAPQSPQRYHEKFQNIDTTQYTNNIYVDSFITIKKYAKARYEASKAGHFGLNVDSYTHFTSPIRRYFDVLVHRILGGIIYTNLPDLLESINNRNHIIDKLNKLHHEWKLYTLINNTKQYIYNAYVIDINIVGLGYLIPEMMLDGWIHVSNILGKKWEYDNDKNVLWSGEVVIGIGSKIIVQLTEVSLIKHRIVSEVIYA